MSELTWQKTKNEDVDKNLSSRVSLPAAGHRVSEGEQAAADAALPPAHLQAAGGGDGGPRTGLPADESLQAHDQGRPASDNSSTTTVTTTAAASHDQMRLIVAAS